MAQTFVFRSAQVPQKTIKYPSKRQKHCSDWKLWNISQMLYRRGEEASMEISTYPVTSRLIHKFFTETVHGNFHVSCNIETNSEILHSTDESIHGNFHVPCNIETNSEILYRNGPWKFPLLFHPKNNSETLCLKDPWKFLCIL